jgi:folate-binding Fe-S cluster repair protein YgfZ
MLKGFGLLKSRRLLKLDGLDAAKFLQGLTTNDIEKCTSGQFTAFLNAQVLSNKKLVLFHFCVYREE